MLASSTTMRDILNNHLVDVQSMMGPERKPWRFNGPWEIYGKCRDLKWSLLCSDINGKQKRKLAEWKFANKCC